MRGLFSLINICVNFILSGISNIVLNPIGPAKPLPLIKFLSHRFSFRPDSDIRLLLLLLRRCHADCGNSWFRHLLFDQSTREASGYQTNCCSSSGKSSLHSFKGRSSHGVGYSEPRGRQPTVFHGTADGKARSS